MGSAGIGAFVSFACPREFRAMHPILLGRAPAGPRRVDAGTRGADAALAFTHAARRVRPSVPKKASFQSSPNADASRRSFDRDGTPPGRSAPADPKRKSFIAPAPR